jgi:streptomycin 6-kinase
VHDDLTRRVVDLHGRRGETWLADLPAWIATCERRWSLVVGAPFPKLRYNWVAPATARDGTALVLKLGVPNPELTSEIEVLRAWGGRGAARLVDADAVQGAILVERLLPGTRLAELDSARDDEATQIALDVVVRLHATPPPAVLRPLAEWTSGLERAHAAGFEPVVVPRALAVRGQLLATSLDAVLLHGDLHHDNILASERGWLAIDPKGVSGDPAYEPATFLYNPLDRVLGCADPALLVGRRLDRFAARFDRTRVIGWAFVQAVLSAWWNFEDHGGGHEPALQFAELVAGLR